MDLGFAAVGSAAHDEWEEDKSPVSAVNAAANKRKNLTTVRSNPAAVSKVDIVTNSKEVGFGRFFGDGMGRKVRRGGSFGESESLYRWEMRILDGFVRVIQESGRGGYRRRLHRVHEEHGSEFFLFLRVCKNFSFGTSLGLLSSVKGKYHDQKSNLVYLCLRFCGLGSRLIVRVCCIVDAVNLFVHLSVRRRVD